MALEYDGRRRFVSLVVALPPMGAGKHCRSGRNECDMRVHLGARCGFRCARRTLRGFSFHADATHPVRQDPERLVVRAGERGRRRTILAAPRTEMEGETAY
ncbi:hypothetical protein GSI_03860 [Ganoderma sinense ZZ0214-1]|uniref:Uncharacterized protein n=1 Tax=Ganoderma sinense ZZ0214-1 TaxID=1077348 RepID=A0A2G8SK59_9APHY|nr:hypothetical protein GSI_03860 [Ganoderma sinense ZZ0214-1]